MKVLVTGGAGFIGSNVVKLLEEKGAKTIILDNFAHANFKNLEGVQGEVVCADILDEAIFKKISKPDAVIHEAAVTDTTLRDDAKMMMVNYNGFKNVLSFCLEHNLRLVYASSAGVYGGGPYPMKEAQSLRPINTYGYSKYLADHTAQKAMKNTKSPLVGLRYFNVYGPGEYHKRKAASMIYQLYCQMKGGRHPRVFKFGEQKRDFIYVKDVARITVEALQLKKSTIVNVGTGQATSFNEIIDILNEQLNVLLKPDYFDNPYEGVYQDYTQADTSLFNQLGFSVRFTADEGIFDYAHNHLQPVAE